MATRWHILIHVKGRSLKTRKPMRYHKDTPFVETVDGIRKSTHLAWAIMGFVVGIVTGIAIAITI